MNKDNLFEILKKSLYDLYRNPAVILPSLILFVLLTLLSVLSADVNKWLNSNILLTIWLVFFSLLSLLIIAFFFSGLIGMSVEVIRKKSSVFDFFKYSKKFWLKNFIIIVIIILVYNVIRYLAHNFALLIGNALNLSVNLAQGVFFLLYFAGLIGIIIFFTFSSFYLIIENRGILKSIDKSFWLVKKRYIYTLSILILFFLINRILDLSQSDIFIELSNSIIIIPYLSLLLSRFVLNFEKVAK